MYYQAGKEIKRIIDMLKIENIEDSDIIDGTDHGELVSKIVMMLADKILKPDDRTREVLNNAAVLHDVGKLKISKNIYGRGKTLQVEEARLMRTHAKLGAEMLATCEYPDDVVEAVLHHHESYDGSGYPSNLIGENIPYVSRVIKVCDAFAALVSDRPYRRAYNMAAAKKMMIDDNKDYDLRILTYFLDLTNEPEFSEIMDLVDELNRKHGYYR